MTFEENHLAFITTNYIILQNDIFHIDVILKIGIINEINQDILIKEWAFITAWNPLPEILTLEENLERNNALLTELISLGYVCHLGKGVSSDGKWQEESFFIENIDKHTALTISNKYGQLAFVHGVLNKEAELVYSTSSK
jgi:hypothetical protein